MDKVLMLQATLEIFFEKKLKKFLGQWKAGSKIVYFFLKVA